MAQKDPLKRLLASTQDMQRARPDEDVFARIQEQIVQGTGKLIPLRQLRIAAACLLLLVALNGITLSYSLHQNQQATQTENDPYSLAKTYHLYRE